MAPALLSLASSPTAANVPGSAPSDTLVAYFSRSGNTKVVAGQIRRAVGADVFEIAPAQPYPEDYETTVEQARKERDTEYRPDLVGRVSRMADYKTVYLGFPIWGGTTPPVIRSFLAAHDLSGKLLVPFMTHGGYGTGDSQEMLRQHARQATLVSGFSIEADQERRTLSLVTEWLASNKSRR